MGKLRKKYAGLDIAKFLCAFVILFYHFFSEHGPIPGIFEDILSLYAVCVALFMVISGFLLYDKLLLIDNEKERWAVVKKQVIRILQIYVIWSIPYLIYSIYRWDFSALTVEMVLWKIQGWVFGSTFSTIWFMPSLAIGILISYFVVEKLPLWACATLTIIAYVVGSLNITYSFVISGYSWYGEIHKFVEMWLNGARGQFLFGFPMVTLGFAVCKYKDKLKLFWAGVLSVVSMAGLLGEALILRRFVGHTGIDMEIFMIPATFFIIIFLISIPIPDFRGCTWMRKMSILIFMSQRLFLTVLPNISVVVRDLYKSQVLSFVIVCGGTFLLSTIIIMLSNKVRWLTKLY